MSQRTAARTAPAAHSGVRDLSALVLLAVSHQDIHMSRAAIPPGGSRHAHGE